jgi:hypothetical protein
VTNWSAASATDNEPVPATTKSGHASAKIFLTGWQFEAVGAFAAAKLANGTGYSLAISLFFEFVAILFVLLPNGISYATAGRIHMTRLTIQVLSLSVRRQCRSGLRSNRQSCEQYDGRHCA